MAFLTKDKVKEIIKNAPTGTSPAGVVAALRKQGHTLEGFGVQQTPGEVPTGGIEVPERSPLDIKGVDPLGFPKIAAKSGLDIVKGLGRAGARPFVQLARGVQAAVPGGKTGQEDIDIPLLGKFEGTETGLPPVKESAIEAGEVLLAGKGEAIFRPIFNKIGALKNFIKDKKGRQALKEIEDLISPKLTAKETRIASEQGRIIRGTESKVFGKRPDTLIQSDSVKKSAGTIQQRIPNANNLTDQQLNINIKKEVGNISKQLKPNLKTVRIDNTQTSKVKKSWEALKKEQFNNPEFEAFAGSKRVQTNFESILKEMSKPVKGADGKFRPKDLNDLWNIRKKYDGTVPEGIKQANTLSSVSDQFKKDMWLDNRRILNDLIKEMSEGLETTAKKSFDAMSDLYSARQNIIGRTSFDVKGTSGLFSPKNLIKGGAATVGAGALYKYID